MSRSTRADIRRKLSVLWAIALVGSLITGTFSAGGAALGDEQLDSSSEQVVETDASALSDTADGSTVTASTDDAASFSTTAATAPAIDVEKLVSIDGGATYDDADSAPGPSVVEGDTLFFRIVVTNTGDVDLDNVIVSDPSLDLSSCAFPSSLGVGASSSCDLGPLAAAGGSTSTTSVTAIEAGGVTTPLPYLGEKRSYWFLFEDGTILEGSTGGGDVEVPFLSDKIHMSCSDEFGYFDDDPDNDGWGESGAPVEGVDPRVILFRIDIFNGDGDLDKSCGFDELGTSVSDSDIAYVDVDLIEPDIDVEKFVSVDNKATWHDADSATGPEAVIGSDVHFRFEVTNTGDTELTDISLTDTDFDTSSCVIPATLAVGGSFDCEIGPFAGVSGQHTNTATVTASGPGGGVFPTADGSKYGYLFLFADGSVLSGTSDEKDADIGLSDTVHLSCSDDFGFDDSDPSNDGWGEKGAPVEGVDPSPIVAYLIGEYNDDGSIKNPCGFGDPTGDSVSDSDDANYFGRPPAPAIDVEKYVSVDGGITFDDADDPTGPATFTGNDVFFRFEVTNTGETELTNLTLTDDVFDTSSCVIPASLAPGGSYDCEIGPFSAIDGQHVDIATATGDSVISAEPPDFNGDDYSFVFVFSDGSVVAGTSADNEAEVPGFSEPFHVSCSDEFGFGNSEPDGWGEKGAPVLGVDPFPITSYLIIKYNSDGTINKTCGEGTTTSTETVSDSDAAHYIARPPVPEVDIEKATNGEDADAAPGPFVAIGDTVTWTYTVTNSGESDLTNISVTDDQGVVSTLIDDADGDAVLSIGETWVYEATGVAVAGQYTNVGTVNGVDVNGVPVTDDDPSNYFGADPDIDIQKDPDLQTVVEGGTAEWTITVTNTGNVTLIDVTVTDALAPGCDRSLGTLIPGQATSYDCSLSGVLDDFTNVAAVEGQPVDDNGDPFGDPVTDEDPADVIVIPLDRTVVIEKATNGEDADDPTGPFIPVGDIVTWTYEVTNNGGVDLFDIVVTDDQGHTTTLIDDGDGDAVLSVGETWVYEAIGIAVAGQYANVGTVNGVDANGTPVTDDDPSHYFGADPQIDLLKLTNGEPGSHGTNCVDGPSVTPGSTVTWTYEVSNIGNVDVTDVVVTDDQGVVPVYMSGDDGDGILNPGETWIYEGTGIATAGVYENLGTAIGDSVAGPVQADDPSCYFGAVPSIDIEKGTNGQDADDPTGPFILVGDQVAWNYTITNTGNVDLTNIIVTDDQGIVPGLVANGDGDNVLAVGESWGYLAFGVAVAGQYENLGSVTGLDPDGVLVADNDPSHYFGADPEIDILKFTNGDPGSHGSNCVDGPYLLVGSPVTWTYEVTNTGNVDITDVVVTDDKGVIPVFVSGDDGDGILNPGETWLYSADGTATAGLYENLGTAVGDSVAGAVQADDPSCYFGADPSIDIEKATNGDDADTPTGPVLEVGEDVTWTYVVTNDGNVDLANVIVTDDQGVAANLIDDGDGDAVLAVGESWTYEGTGTAVVGQYENLGSVTALDPQGTLVADNDPSHYLGVMPGIQILKFTNGEPGSHGTNCVDGPYLLVGSPVTWTYEVTNTGTVDITDVVVTDDQGVVPVFVSGDDGDLILNPGETWLYSADGTATAGLYENTGLVEGDANGTTVADADPSCYFGADPSIDIEKATNGEDADTPTGPELIVGDAVTWTYVVTNTGNVDIANVVVTDDILGVIAGPDSGDDGDGILNVGEVWTYSTNGVAELGQYANLGTVTGDDPEGNPVNDNDPSHYIGVPPDAPAIQILKFTNGDPGSHGTNCVDGPYLLVGSPVTWTYEVTNTGTVDITDVVVTDDQGVVPVFVSGDDGDGILNPGETWLYSADGTATAGVYENTGIVDGDGSGTPVSDTDPSCYFGADPSIDIEKATNGEDADTPTGPELIVGDAVTWTYVVTNTGNVDIANVVVTDDILGVIAGPDSGDDGDGILNVGEVWTYSTNGVAELGQYANLGTVTGDDPEGNPVNDNDPSHYIGVPPDAPAIQILKFTNGDPGSHGTNCVDGPYLLVGSPVTWTYEVTNIGNLDIFSVGVSDDIIGPIAGPDSGDDGDGVLNPGETWIYSVDGVATAGLYENLGTVNGDTTAGGVSDTDPSCYFGADPSIDIEKATNGEDADTPTGPVLLAGDAVTWTYVVTNTGNVDLDNVIVTDDQGEIPVFMSGDDGDGILNVGESWTYEATGTAVVGQYENLGSVTAVDAGGTLVADNDPSHYLVEDIVTPPAIHIEKTTNGFDADLPTGPEIQIGKAVVWRYFVTNTGTTPLSMVVVTDDKGVVPIRISGDTNGNLLLDPGEEWMYRAFGTAVAGQYENLGSVTAKDPNGVLVADNDPSHYFGKRLAECPLTGDGVIFITNTELLNRDGRDIFGPVAVSVGPGTYEVTLAGFDTHSTKPPQVQPNEQYYVELLDVNGNVVYTSPAISDLPDDQDWIIEVVDTNAVVTGDATQMFAFHVRVANSNVNSIIPVCAQFVPVPPLPAGSIGDFVWEDVNADGVQDAFEPGIEGAVVELWDSGLTTLLGTTTTDAAGKYLFEDLPAGDYIVIFDGSAANAALLASPANAGSNDEVDSDAAVDSGESPVITLGIDEDNLTIDAGFYLPVALGDRVWRDLNSDGIQDAGEPGVAGVTVLLKDAGGSVIGSTTTDSDGLYLFSNLTPGTYSIGVELPAGFSFSPADQGGDDAVDSDIDPVTAMSGNVTLNSGDTNVTLDAGLVDLARGISIEKATNGEDADAPTGPLVPVGDTVTWTYEVTNAGQTDLFDVVVTDDQGALPVFVSGDDGDGILNPGETWIYEATGVATAGQYANLGSVSASDVVGPLTDDDPSHYFGANPSILIEKDPDTQTVVEGGTASWTITVTNTGNVTLTDVTVSDPLAPDCDANLGTLIPGQATSYDCELAGVLESFTNIADVVGTPPLGPPVVDDDPADVEVILLPRSISIEKSTNGEDADAPTGPLVPVGDTVTWTYVVTNDGGVDLIDVLVTDDQGVVPVLVDNADGDAVLSVGETWVYEVSGVAVAGQYENLGSVTATDVAGLMVGANDPSHYFGTDPSILIEKDPDTQTVVEGGTATWTITVTNTGNMTLVDVTVTDVLAPGCDAVILSAMAPGDVVSYDCELAGVTADFTNVAAVVGQPVDGNGDPIGDPVTDDDPADVIVTLLSALGDRVWEDVNGNGIQDQGELGIGNVTVNLMDSAMNVIGTTVTGPSGLYSFVDLLPGEYFVQFITPAGVVPTTPDVGADDAVDSDAGVDGKTPLITLPGGTSDDTWDAGFYALASIGDTVWRDRGSEPNGIQDAGEPGVAGVAVDLLDGEGNVIASTVTNADGFYEFTGLAPGTYQVVFTAPDGATWTDSNVGADDTVDSDADAAGITPAVTLSSGENNDTIDGGLVIPIDLEIAKEALPEGVFPGTEFIYQLRINNVGGVDAQGVVVLDLLPYRDVDSDPQDLDPSHPFAIFPCFSETVECVGNPFWQINSEPLDDERNPFQNSSYVSFSAPAGVTCVYFADVHGVECEVGDLAAGGYVEIDLTLQMGIFAQDRVWNRTYVYADDFEANINKVDPTTPCATLPGVDPDAQGFGCNHDKKNETIVGSLDLGVVMSVDAAQASPGDLLTYTIDATNYGAAGARDGHVVIALPDGFNVKSISAPECSVSDLSLDCAYPLWVPATFDLLSSLKQIELTGWVDADFTGELIARSQVEDRDTSPSAFPDGDPTNNEAQVSTLVAAFQTPIIDLEATITAEPTSVQAGQDSLVTATITNAGPDDATGVVASVVLPTQASIVSSAGSGVLLGNQWLIGDLAAGASVSVQLMTKINEAGSFLVLVEVTEADQADSDSIPGDGTGDDFAMAPVTATSVLQSQATTTTTTAATGGTETLPRTGLDSGALGGLGIGLILLGGFAVVGVRRREDFENNK